MPWDLLEYKEEHERACYMTATSLAGSPMLAVILPAGLQWGSNELLVTEEMKM